MKISVAGLGKLGAPLVAVMASRGHEVVGLDTDRGRVHALHSGHAPVQETGLQSLIDANRTNISATTNFADAVAKTELTFVVVPTPSGPDGQFSLDHVRAAITKIGFAIGIKQGYHLVVLCSTVMPGAMDQVVRPVLEEASGRKCGEELGLCYNPEFVALGSVIRDMLNPDLVLIGESDAAAGRMLASLYERLCYSKPELCRMNFVNAELTKLSINSFVTMKLSYANMLAELCEKLPGGDVDVVTQAVGSDSRVGFKSLKGATGYGGPCFARDNIAFSTFAISRGCSADLPLATDRINHAQVSRLAGVILTHLPIGGTVGILGLSYKPNTNVVEASHGVALALVLTGRGCPVIVHDPASMANAAPLLPPDVTFAKSAEDCAKASDVLVLMTPWPEYSCLDPGVLLEHAVRPVVLDCWRVLPAEQFSLASKYLRIGRGEETTADCRWRERAALLDSDSSDGLAATSQSPDGAITP